MLFADDQAILAENEDDLQRAVHNLGKEAKKYNMKISAAKTKVIAFEGKDLVRSEIVIDEKAIEQANVFKYLETEVSYMGEVDVDRKTVKFLKVSGIINRILPASKIRRETRL